ncbi:hypothetical protein BCU70_13560 [Vibrio sp. 10N.286.49.C2]|uniref:sensor domain-containing diguanylate cyclase n=1 Tax=unclassified Vibrio TaxID=2614977 RepID=UPI000C861B08|nr:MULTISPECIES: sensor domain-containing diguanylate cyclase [unclassified Vibrio]PMH38827.1 hypothetical protein BCU70_13560 [Vibrio sp. 10N.286.49.C2]PMH55303.1 hypothetical protein BCU66_09330 [Vibrio sp. 10N.286.49.B1]PMH83802.1 hypothetical protein BCU58_13515 [Vibrio sp. 10N.286.48.B7]
MTAKSTIRKDLFKSSMLLTFLLIGVIGSFVSSALYEIRVNKAYEVIKQRNLALNYLLDGHFREISNFVLVAGQTEAAASAGDLDSEKKVDLLKFYADVSNANERISYIYSGYENGTMIINDYEIPENYDPTKRPWYTAAVVSYPHISTGLPYQEASDNEWLIATSVAFKDEHDKVIGVLSVDSSVAKIVNILKQQTTSYQSAYSFVIKGDGEIIIHPDSDMLTKNITDLVGKNNNPDQGYFDYKFGEATNVGYTSTLNKTGWQLITVVNRLEIVKPIISNVVTHSVIVALFAIILGLLQSNALSKRYSLPLIELQKRLTYIIEGSPESRSSYRYPNNEIGSIAQEVEQFTTQEFYTQSVELKRLNDQTNQAYMLLAQKNDELKRLSYTDQLTALSNRHKMELELQREHDRYQRYGDPFSLIMLDIDAFKLVNDTYGHNTGDIVLRSTADRLKACVRGLDIVGRWGGEEFLILCPRTKLNQAHYLANKLRQQVEEVLYEDAGHVTVSAGVSQIQSSENITHLLKRADCNLYQAKEQGKNRVISS